MTSSTPASSDAATSWVSALSCLPPRQRLDWQRTITADVAAQGGTAATAAAGLEGAAVPCSRAYASGSAEGDVLPGLISGSAFGQHVTAVSRSFTTTRGLIAEFIASAMETAGVHAPFPAAAGDALSAGSSSLEEQSEAECRRIAQSVAAAGLDTAYRPVVLKYLQRRLASDPCWAEEPHRAARFPGVERVASGEALVEAQAALVEQQVARQQRTAAARARAEAAAAAGVHGGGAGAEGHGDLSMLDAALDEMLG